MSTDRQLLFGAVRNHHWFWGLGDPDLGAVLVTGLYLLTAVVCLLLSRQLRRNSAPVPLIRPAATFSPGIEGEVLEYGGGNGGRSQKYEVPTGPDRLLTPDTVSAASVPSSGLRPPSPPASREKDENKGPFPLRPLIQPVATPPHPGYAHLLPRFQGRREKSEARYWLVLALLLFLLGINKQGDFQSLLTLYGRDILRQAGLYDVRRTIQFVFIIGVALSAIASVLLCLWIVRRLSWPCRTAAVGLGLQAFFVVVRAASFHHVDTLLGMRLGNLKLNLLFESVGLTVMLLSAMFCWAGNRAEGNTE